MTRLSAATLHSLGVIAQEAQQDGWYLLHTNESVQQCPGEQVLGHYKGLLDVEEAFCELKSYLEVRPSITGEPTGWSTMFASAFWPIG